VRLFERESIADTGHPLGSILVSAEHFDLGSGLVCGAARMADSAALLALNCAIIAAVISPVRPRPFPQRSKPITIPESKPSSNIKRIAVDRSALSASATLAIFLSIFRGRRTPTIGSWPVGGRPHFRARFRMSFMLTQNIVDDNAHLGLVGPLSHRLGTSWPIRQAASLDADEPAVLTQIACTDRISSQREVVHPHYDGSVGIATFPDFSPAGKLEI
jgi:hypothetical protein